MRWKVGKAMPRSMTGYGRYELQENERKVLVEISSVNHRYLDLNIRMPRALMHLEDAVRKKLKTKLARGKVEVSITYQSTSEEELEVVINETLGKAYLEGLRNMGSQFGLEDDLKLSALMNVNELITLQKRSIDQDKVGQMLSAAIDGALETLIEMRKNEGEALKRDILIKNAKLYELTNAIELRSPQVVCHYQERLRARLGQLLIDTPIDEARIIAEVALFADKCAIDEELTRLKSHMKQLEEILTEGSVVGRKLDFLMQEMNREANTMGSKANDYEITKYVVDLKTEIEKIREQVQNIE